MITKEQFEEATGRPPEFDDLQRSNCEHAGEIGHFSCGWCLLHEKPEFICGCRVKKLAEQTS